MRCKLNYISIKHAFQVDAVVNSYLLFLDITHSWRVQQDSTPLFTTFSLLPRYVDIFTQELLIETIFWVTDFQVPNIQIAKSDILFTSKLKNNNWT